MNWIKYFLILSGVAVSVYGYTQDYDLVIFLGVALFVIGIILRSIIEIFTGKKNNSTNKA